MTDQKVVARQYATCEAPAMNNVTPTVEMVAAELARLGADGVEGITALSVERAICMLYSRSEDGIAARRGRTVEWLGAAPSHQRGPAADMLRRLRSLPDDAGVEATWKALLRDEEPLRDADVVLFDPADGEVVRLLEEARPEGMRTAVEILLPGLRSHVAPGFETERDVTGWPSCRWTGEAS